jgi:hypothetical protein
VLVAAVAEALPQLELKEINLPLETVVMALLHLFLVAALPTQVAVEVADILLAVLLLVLVVVAVVEPEARQMRVLELLELQTPEAVVAEVVALVERVQMVAPASSFFATQSLFRP